MDITAKWWFWSNIKKTSILNLAYLSKGINPCHPAIVLEQPIKKYGLDTIIELAMRDPFLNKIETGSSLDEFGEDAPDPALTIVWCKDFAEWAASLTPPWLGKPPPPEFPGLSRKSLIESANTNTEGHPCYARNLAIALEAWTALYANGSGEKPRGGHKNHIKQWLAKRYPEMTKEMTDRIAVLVNPDPNGGATPTE